MKLPLDLNYALNSPLFYAIIELLMLMTFLPDQVNKYFSLPMVLPGAGLLTLSSYAANTFLLICHPVLGLPRS
jgi:hypothetical protein